MAIGNPVLGRKIVQVDPDGRRMACCHGLFVDFRQAAGECFDDDIAGFAMLKRSHPAAHFDECFQIRLLVPCRYELRIALGVQRWAQWLERGQVVEAGRFGELLQAPQSALLRRFKAHQQA